MAYTTTPTTSYVRFVRGTKQQYQQLTLSDDTLYFVYDTIDSTKGELYLGDKLIGDGSITSLSELIEGTVADGDLLIYDEASESWISTSPDNAIRIMTGATAAADGQSGLVPAPKIGDQTKFLRGDGTWVEVSVGTLAADEETISLSPTNKLTLKGFNNATVGSFLQKTNDVIAWVSAPTLTGGLTYKKVSTLNDINETSTIYFVPNNSGTTNSYDEYMYIDNKAELIGNTSNINLDGYVTQQVFEAAVGTLQTNIDAKVNKTNFNTLSNKVTEIDSRLTWQEIVDY